MSLLPHFCTGSRPSSQTVRTHIIEHAGDSPGVRLRSAQRSRDGPKSGLRAAAGQLRVPGAQVCRGRTGQWADVRPPQQEGPSCWAWLAHDSGALQGLSGAAARVKGGYGGKVLPSAVRTPGSLTATYIPSTRLHLRKPSWAGGPQPQSSSETTVTVTEGPGQREPYLGSILEEPGRQWNRETGAGPRLCLDEKAGSCQPSG